MKTNIKGIVVFSIMFTMLFSACEKKETRPSVIYITSTVKDKKNSLPIDSVKTKLYQSYIDGDLLIKEFYTDKNGKVEFDFSPEKNKSYYLHFVKEGYLQSGDECKCKEDINLDEEKQNFNIQLIEK